MDKSKFLLYVNKVLYILKSSKLPNNEKIFSYLKKQYHLLRPNAFINLINSKVIPYIKANVSNEKINEFDFEFEKHKTELGNRQLFDPDYLISYLIATYKDNINYARNHLFEYENKEIMAVLNTKKAKGYFKYDDPYMFYYEYKCNFSSTTIDFITKQNIDVCNFFDMEDTYLKGEKDINEIVSDYGIFDMNMKDDISYVYIGDVFGTSHKNKRINILNTISDYYDYNGDSYHSRANGLLEYSDGKSLIAGLLKKGLEREPIKLNEIEKEKYIVSTNGMHRFTMIKIHYLKDKLSGMSEEELRSIYTIPVHVGYRVNYIKTYSNYLLSMLDPTFSRINNFKEYTLQYKDGKKIELTDDILVDIVREKMNNSNFSLIKEEIEKLIEKYPSFREYMSLLLNMENGVKHGI